MDATFALGLYTFGDLTPEAKAGKAKLLTEAKAQ